jgi:hypothetical protein
MQRHRCTFSHHLETVAMKTLRIDTWIYNAAMVISALVVAVAIPVGVIALLMVALGLL